MWRKLAESWLLTDHLFLIDIQSTVQNVYASTICKIIEIFSQGLASLSII